MYIYVKVNPAKFTEEFTKLPWCSISIYCYNDLNEKTIGSW